MEKKENTDVVTAAVIENNGRLLIAKRRQGGKFAGKWEFPGGKVERGETPEECLRRELEEELSIKARIGNLFCAVEHSYIPQLTIKLLVYRATVVSGDFNLNVNEEIRWVQPENLSRYNFLEA